MLTKSSKHFAGIGSRSMPASEKWKIDKIVDLTNDLDMILRSGAAEGADTFFQLQSWKSEIFLPWNGFAGKSVEKSTKNIEYIVPKYDESYVNRFHPKPQNLTASGKKLMSRNTNQVLGRNFDDPVEFVACWTPSGKDEGGTAQACRIARHLKIPVYNLNNEKEFRTILSILEDRLTLGMYE